VGTPPEAGGGIAPAAGDDHRRDGENDEGHDAEHRAGVAEPFGADRHGPFAPVACQFGKNDVFTVTGTPTRLTWKLIELSVVVMSVTVVLGTATAGAAPAVAAVTFGHDAKPPAVSATPQRAGSSYQASDGPAIGSPSGPTLPSHVPWLGPTPCNTAGSLVNGVTSAESRTS
jgi:hypothetical protein